jgi:predicted alpha/beta-fold hydrolase
LDTFIPFVARRGLSGGHKQTVASFLLRRKFKVRPGEERRVEVEPGVKLRCWCHWQADRASALTVIVLHGLEGSSESHYMLGIAEKGMDAGMNVIRVNQRNCGGTSDFSPTLYHSGRSADVAAVAKHFVKRDGVTRFALSGYSMGGNLVLKCAGEWGASAPPEFRGVAAVCPAADLAPSADALHDPPNRLYEAYFMWQLRKTFRNKARLFPKAFDPARLQGVKTIRDFDEKVTAYYSGFAGASDYYARASASNVIDRIAVPTLWIHAANDPFIRILPDTRRKIAANPRFTFIETADGGHCSFLGERNGYDGHWAEKQVVEFLGKL